jgi:hypothetical protein
MGAEFLESSDRVVRQRSATEECDRGVRQRSATEEWNRGVRTEADECNNRKTKTERIVFVFLFLIEQCHAKAAKGTALMSLSPPHRMAPLDYTRGGAIHEKSGAGEKWGGDPTQPRTMAGRGIPRNGTSPISPRPPHRMSPLDYTRGQTHFFSFCTVRAVQKQISANL